MTTEVNLETVESLSPANLQPDDYKRMVGVAWTSSTNESYKTVKVAVGLNDGDINKVVVENNKMLDVLKSNFDKTNSAIAALLPEFKRGVQTPELSNSIIMAPDNKIIKSKNYILGRVSKQKRSINENCSAQYLPFIIDVRVFKLYCE